MKHYNTLQHTATHCNTLQHTATQYNTLQHTATHTATVSCVSGHHTGWWVGFFWWSCPEALLHPAPKSLLLLLATLLLTLTTLHSPGSDYNADGEVILMQPDGRHHRKSRVWRIVFDEYNCVGR